MRLELARDELSRSVVAALGDAARFGSERGRPGRDVRRLAAGAGPREGPNVVPLRERLLEPDDHVEHHIAECRELHWHNRPTSCSACSHRRDEIELARRPERSIVPVRASNRPGLPRARPPRSAGPSGGATAGGASRARAPRRRTSMNVALCCRLDRVTDRPEAGRGAAHDDPAARAQPAARRGEGELEAAARPVGRVSRARESAAASRGTRRSRRCSAAGTSRGLRSRRAA